MISHRKPSKITLDKWTEPHEINNSQQPAEKCGEDINNWNCLRIGKRKLLIIDRTPYRLMTSAFIWAQTQRHIFFYLQMDEQDKTKTAGCFYSLLIWDLLQAAQQFGGMLTALKSHCKQTFWIADLTISDVSTSSLPHSTG